jgi:sugar lactone lactonase YvrE
MSAPVSRLAAEAGELAEGPFWDASAGGLYRVDIPTENVTSCVFGGPGLDTLYVTTAAGAGTDLGAVFSCPAGVTGQPSHPYRG